MPFRDRAEAGRQLATRLGPLRDQKPVVLALPRGGVPVAAEVARALSAPLDLLLVRKIGVPFQPELAMGAVADGGHPVVVRNEDVIRQAGISDDQFRSVCDAEMQEIERRRTRYLGERRRVPLAGRTVIVIDDGIATGATMRAGLRAVRAAQAAQIILAVPVGPPDTLEEMKTEADAVICLEEHRDLGAIGLYFSDFRQVSDEEVVETLSQTADT